MSGCRFLAFGRGPSVDLVHLDLVDLLALDEVGLAGFVDLDLLQHLPNDHFDVLVVDRHALEPIDLLDLIDQVAGKLLDPFDRQDVVRRRVAFDDEVALLDHVAVLQVDVLALGDEYSLGSSPLSVGSIVMRRLFLSSRPKRTVPEISAMTANSWAVGPRTIRRHAADRR